MHMYLQQHQGPKESSKQEGTEARYEILGPKHVEYILVISKEILMPPPPPSPQATADPSSSTSYLCSASPAQIQTYPIFRSIYFQLQGPFRLKKLQGK